MSHAIRATAALGMLASLTAGCEIYIDNPHQCTLPPFEPPLLLLDPVSGECIQYDLGPICDPDTCECADLPVAIPSWAPCNSYCTGLDQLECQATPGCRAAYRPDGYHGCFATDLTGPIQGECGGLDAWECSRHDDCIANHDGGFYIALDPAPPVLPLGRFLSCEDELTPCTTNDDCSAGERCNAQDICIVPPECRDNPACDFVCGGYCVPEERSECFGEVFCDVAVPECPPGSTPGTSNGCYTGECIPLSDCAPVPFEECYGQPTCDSAWPTCPEGHAPQLRNGCWTGQCIPFGLCEPEPTPTPGSCFGEFTCDVDPPQCDEGFVPGVSNGCFDGTCILLDKCGSWPPSLFCTGDVLCEREPPFCPQGYTPLIDGTCWTDICVPAEMCQSQPECSSIGDEESCQSAPGCTPVYTGVDCTCSPDGGCTCESWKFDRCQ